MLITKPGTYKTRGGNKATVLCLDSPGIHPCIGYIDDVESLRPVSWTSEGRILHGVRQGDDIVATWTAFSFDWSRFGTYWRGVAMDEDGTWYLFRSVAEISVEVWLSASDIFRLNEDSCPVFTGDWQDSWHENPTYKE